MATPTTGSDTTQMLVRILEELDRISSILLTPAETIRKVNQPYHLLRVSEVSRILGISSTKTLGLIESGELLAVRVGSRWRVSQGVLDQWMEARLGGGAQ